jgi:serine/threonine-protein kinase RsbW
LIQIAEYDDTGQTNATMSSTDIPDDPPGPERPLPGGRLPECPVEPAPHSLLRPQLWLQLRAEMIAPSVARFRVRRWLTGLSWPAGQREDIVLAVSEAVSNAAEHAYLDTAPGVIEVHGATETTSGGQHRVTIIVDDHGRWRPAPLADENRRRGIPLMRACMDTVTIESRDTARTGTRVILYSRVVPTLGAGG